MAGKNKGAIDPVAIRELISQGIPMKKKESEMIPSPGIEEVDESVSKTQKEALEEPVSYTPLTLPTMCQV